MRLLLLVVAWHYQLVYLLAERSPQERDDRNRQSSRRIKIMTSQYKMEGHDFILVVFCIPVARWRARVVPPTPHLPGLEPERSVGPRAGIGMDPIRFLLPFQ